MKKHVIMIDYENVQPNMQKIENLSEPFVLMVFCNKQNNISIKNFKFLTQIKEKVEIIELLCGGKNALDFHIAFYLGCLITKLKTNNTQFHIISKDNGFDNLVEFAKEFCGVSVVKEQSIPIF